MNKENENRASFEKAKNAFNKLKSLNWSKYKEEAGSLLNLTADFLALSLMASTLASDFVEVVGKIGIYEYENILAACLFITFGLTSVAGWCFIKRVSWGSNNGHLLSFRIAPYFIALMLFNNATVLSGELIYEYLEKEALVFIDNNMIVLLISLAFMGILFKLTLETDYPLHQSVEKPAGRAVLFKEDNYADRVRIHEAAHYLFYKLFDSDERFISHDELIVARKSHVNNSGGFMRKSESGMNAKVNEVAMMTYAGYLAENVVYGKNRDFSQEYSDYKDFQSYYAMMMVYWADQGEPIMSLSEYMDYIEGKSVKIIKENAGILMSISELLKKHGDVCTVTDLKRAGILDAILEVKNKMK